MKKLLLGLLILALCTPVFAKIKPKHLAGSWNYTVQTDQGSLTGTFKFTKVKKDLKGEVVTDDGMTMTMEKLEIKDGDVLYFEVTPDYEALRVTINIADDAFEGTVSFSQGDAPISGQKQE